MSKEPEARAGQTGGDVTRLKMMSPADLAGHIGFPKSPKRNWRPAVAGVAGVTPPPARPAESAGEHLADLDATRESVADRIALAEHLGDEARAAILRKAQGFLTRLRALAATQREAAEGVYDRWAGADRGAAAWLRGQAREPLLRRIEAVLSAVTRVAEQMLP